ncbi:MAG: hypothetical protein WCA78_13955 [Rhizomicrobium sp.]
MSDHDPLDFRTALEPFGDWRRAHAAALAAWCLEHLPIGNSDEPRAEMALVWLEQVFMKAESSDGESAITQHRIRSLPAYTSGMLARLASFPYLPSSIQWLPEVAANQVESLTEDRKPQPSRARAANLIADAVLSGTVPAQGILNMMMWLVTGLWRKVDVAHPFAQRLEVALPVLRDWPGDIARKLEVLAALRCAHDSLYSTDSFMSSLLGWGSIEGCILDRLFTWPLFADGNALGSQTFGIGLPVYVGASFDSDDVEPQIYGFTDGRLNLGEGFFESIKAADRAARDLWRKECGHLGQNWIGRILDHSSIGVNFSPAEAILAEFEPVERGKHRFHIRIDGRSADLPFALAGFARLRGLRYPSAIAATGVISDPAYRDIEWNADMPAWAQVGISALDRELDLPECLVEKIRWADAVSFYDATILPLADLRGASPEATRLAEYLRTDRKSAGSKTELNWCKKLSNAADVAFSGAWRRWQFVRCPDVQHFVLTLASSADSLSDCDILRILNASASPIVVMPSSISVLDVAGAMVRLNETDARRRYESADGIPPMLSVSFIRLVPDEGGDRLCGTLCEIAGAPYSVLEKVCTSPSPAVRGHALANVLNHNELDPAAPGWRPADLMVLSLPGTVLSKLGPRLLAVEAQAPEWIQVLEPILHPSFVALLRRTVDSRWGPTFGRARVLLVAEATAPAQLPTTSGDDEPDTGPIDGVAEITPVDLHQVVELLSVFRFDFTQQEAGILLSELGINSTVVRSTLKRLEREGLVYQIPGAWCLTHRPIECETDNEMIFLRHWSAAIAHAPSLSPKRLPGLADFQARRLDRVHEAQFHLEEAIRCAQELAHGGNYREDRLPPFTLLFAQQARLRSYFDVPGWDYVHARLADGHLPEGYRLLNAEMLVRRALAENSPLPTKNAIMFLRLIWRQMRTIEQKYPTHWAARADPHWRSMAEKLTQFALSSLGVAGSSESSLMNDLHSTLTRSRADLSETETIGEYTSVVCALLASRIQLPSGVRAELNTWLKSAIATVPSTVIGLRPAWLEDQGDQENNDLQAAIWYRHGYRADPTYAQNWVKALGCCGYDDERIGSVLADFDAFRTSDPDGARRVFNFVKKRQPELKKERRWAAGLQHLVDNDLLS